MNLWLERSATLPISLSLHGTSGDDGTHKNLTALKQSLQRFCHKLSHLCLCLPLAEDVYMFNLLLPPSTPLPALFALTLIGYVGSLLPTSTGYDPFFTYLDSFQMPALQSLDIHRGNDCHALGIYRLPTFPAYHYITCFRRISGSDTLPLCFCFTFSFTVHFL